MPSLEDILDSVKEDWQNQNVERLISECEFEEDLEKYTDMRSEDYYNEEAE